jgi:D-3-phosphoglycerate dehydrogenase
MNRFKVVLLEHGYASSDAERKIVESAGGSFVDCDTWPRKQALAECLDADGVLVRRMELTRELLEKYFRKVKVIVRYGVGVDNIDPVAATELGILLSRVPDYCLEEVSDHAVALLLALTRGLVERNDVMRAGGWDRERVQPLPRIAKMTVGLVAFGQIARRTARKLQGWGLRLLAHDPYVEEETIRAAGVEPVSFECLLRESDAVLVHAPMLPENHHLFNRESLTLMKRGAILVNTGRGGLVDLDALCETLQSGGLGGAGLDVFEQEPLTPGHQIRTMPNVILTDHAAWYSESSQRDLQRTAAEEVTRGAAGELPKTIANPEVLARLKRTDEWSGDAASGWMARRAEILSARNPAP